MLSLIKKVIKTFIAKNDLPPALIFEVVLQSLYAFSLRFLLYNLRH